MGSASRLCARVGQSLHISHTRSYWLVCTPDMPLNKHQGGNGVVFGQTTPVLSFPCHAIHNNDVMRELHI